MKATLFLTFFLVISSFASAQEICDNGIDDDNNGLIDLEDPACNCKDSLGNSVMSYIATVNPSPVELDNPIAQCTVFPDTLKYTWLFEDGTTTSATSFTHNFGSIEGNEQITLLVENSIGCLDSTKISVSKIARVIYYIPNSFTPDGDEYNNSFQPVFTSGFDPYNFHLSVFNRWGEVVFESNDVVKGWDGTYHGELAQQGVYLWTIHFKNPNDDTKTDLSGTVSVIK